MMKSVILPHNLKKKMREVIPNFKSDLLKSIERSNGTKIREIFQCGIILVKGSMKGLYILIVLQKASNKWGLPKGHLNTKEQKYNLYLECASRELREETGIHLSVEPHYRIGEILLSGKMFYIVFVNEPSSGIDPMDKKEISGFRWLHVANIHNFSVKNECNRTIGDLLPIDKR
jgi:8-oxo-dGTP pyrophosphatase MutT (NUDIX family)